MNISSGNGLDKTVDLAKVRAGLVTQLNTPVKALKGRDHGAARRSRREADAALAEMAGTSIEDVRAARRLAGSDSENLAVAVFSQLSRVRFALCLSADLYEAYCWAAHLLLEAAFEESKDGDRLRIGDAVRKIDTAITAHHGRMTEGRHIVDLRR